MKLTVEPVPSEKMLVFIEFLTIPPLNVAVLAPPTVDALLSLVITARVEKYPG